MRAATRSQGNLRGLPAVETRDDLTKVLTSLLYRVNAHGGGTLVPAVNPVLAFVATFPPCLQSAAIIEPGTPVDPTKDLLPLLPHTGTIGEMTTFFFTFVYSPPSEPLIPLAGITAEPHFPPSQSRATRRCSSTGRTSTTSSTPSSRTGTRRLRGSAGPRDHRRRMPAISTSSGPSASSSESARRASVIRRGPMSPPWRHRLHPRHPDTEG